MRKLGKYNLIACSLLTLIGLVPALQNNSINESATTNYGVGEVNKLAVGTSTKVITSKTFTQATKIGNKYYLRYATAVTGPIKSVKYTRDAFGEKAARTSEVTTLYKGLALGDKVYHFDTTTKELTTEGDKAKEYYFACYTIEFTNETLLKTNISVQLEVTAEDSTVTKVDKVAANVDALLPKDPVETLNTYRIEAEYANIISSVNNNEKANNIALSNAVHKGDCFELGTNSFSGFGYLSEFADTNYKFSYTFSSNQASNVNFSLRANSLHMTTKKPQKDVKFVDAIQSVTLNGNPINITPDTLVKKQTWSDIAFAGNVKNGENILEFKCNNKAAIAIDYIDAKTTARLTRTCDEKHKNLDWIVFTKPTETKTGLMYRICSTCGHAESVVLPKLGTPELKAGAKVAKTALVDSYTPFTYTHEGKTYKFNIYDNDLEKTRNFYDFDSIPFECPWYVPFPTMHIKSGDSRKTINGIPTKVNAKIKANNNTSLSSQTSKGSTDGLGIFTLKVNSSEKATANIEISAAASGGGDKTIRKGLMLSANDQTYISEVNFIAKDPNKSHFTFEDRMISKVNLLKGENIIKLELTGYYTNIDGLVIETSAKLTEIK